MCSYVKFDFLQFLDILCNDCRYNKNRIDNYFWKMYKNGKNNNKIKTNELLGTSPSPLR